MIRRDFPTGVWECRDDCLCLIQGHHAVGCYFVPKPKGEIERIERLAVEMVFKRMVEDAKRPSRFIPDVE